jgi:NtrC-family two-component system response regulator AlgB
LRWSSSRRLNIVELTLPPLRHRTDTAALADHLLVFFARRMGRRLIGFTPEARDTMAHYAWPGNLRELCNAVERAAIVAGGPEVGTADLPEHVRARVSRNGRIEVGGRVRLQSLEAEHIRRILGRTPSLDEAARVLGIDPSTLYRKRKRLGL